MAFDTVCLNSYPQMDEGERQNLLTRLQVYDQGPNNVAPRSGRLNKAVFRQCPVIPSFPCIHVTKSAEESVLKSHCNLSFHHSMNLAFRVVGY